MHNFGKKMASADIAVAKAGWVGRLVTKSLGRSELNRLGLICLWPVFHRWCSDFRKAPG